MAYDLVVRDGTVVDGSGGPAYRADVGVVGDRIATIGRIREAGATEVDAEGHLVTPGFVEVHTHLDAQLHWDPLATSSSWHGVTTAVMGNCGFTLAPCRASEADLVLRTLERAEDMARDALLAGLDWRWETYAQFLDVVDAVPKGINYAGYLGHSALRTYVMGERAFDGAATDDDVRAMRAELTDGLRAGAIGLSTSRSPNHETADDRPVPSRLADWSEVEALVGVLGELGAGTFQLANEQPPTAEEVAAYRERLVALAATTGRPITYIVGAGHPGNRAWQEQLALFEAAAARGARMFGQVHSRQFLTVTSFATKLVFDRLPAWSQVRSKPWAEQRAALVDPAVRATLVDEALHGTYGRAIGAEARAPRWDALFVLDSGAGPWTTVGALAAQQGTTPVDVMIDLGLATDGAALFGQPFGNEDLDAVLALIRDPRTVVGVSDTGAHVSQVIDTSIPTFLLAHWVRARQALTWEDAVRKLTFEPAARFGFAGRGLVQEGMVADLVVLDPERVAPAVPYAAHDLPAGAPRLKQEAVGIRATVVGGEVLVRDGRHTEARPGRLLRGPLAVR
jgi:N-acyl-D-aspartate/D-glutamate deacylase